MGHSEPADFFLTGLVVVWPVLLWSGHYELGVLAFFMLLFAAWVCGMVAGGKDDGRTRGPARDTDAPDRSSGA